MIKRRHFIWGLVAGGSVAALLGLRIGLSSREAGVIAILRKRLPYLKLDENDLHQFAREFLTKAEMSPAKLRLIAAFAPLYGRLSTSPEHLVARTLRFGEERIAARFLLSSDFFTNGADETRVVRYVGFYDPLRACGNPFARPVLLTDAATAARPSPERPG
jgi:hypothetical protein